MKNIVIVFCLYMISARGYAQNVNDSLLKIFIQKEQSLVDAITVGDKTVWIATLHDSCIISVEDGSSMTKEKIVADINPLPKGFSGMIKVIEPKLQTYDNTAVISFINDEYEEVYGQHIHTQYRQTDTWMKINNEWKVISMELFEIPKNPPPVVIPATVLLKYVGVYTLSEDRQCEITVDSGKIYANKNGKDRVELLPETENVFFRNGNGRVDVLFIKDATSGKYNMVERREGEDLVWRKKN